MPSGNKPLPEPMLTHLCRHIPQRVNTCGNDFQLRPSSSKNTSFCPSICRSVCLSVCLSYPFHYVPVIVSSWNFQGVHARGQGPRSKVKVTEVKTQFSHFRTVTVVWIRIWLRNDAQSWKQNRRAALLFFKVICEISRSHGTENRRFWPELSISGL